LVPRVAAAAVVPLAGAADDGERLLPHPLVDHVPGDLVLDAGPDLVAVEDRVRGPAAAGPGAAEEALVVPVREDALAVPELGEVREPVMAEDSREGGADLIFRQ